MNFVGSPDSSEEEHLHGKQAVVGSSPILGKEKILYTLMEELKIWLKKLLKG